MNCQIFSTPSQVHVSKFILHWNLEKNQLSTLIVPKALSGINCIASFYLKINTFPNRKLKILC